MNKSEKSILPLTSAIGPKLMIGAMLSAGSAGCAAATGADCGVSGAPPTVSSADGASPRDRRAFLAVVVVLVPRQLRRVVTSVGGALAAAPGAGCPGFLTRSRRLTRPVASI